MCIITKWRDSTSIMTMWEQNAACQCSIGQLMVSTAMAHPCLNISHASEELSCYKFPTWIRSVSTCLKTHWLIQWLTSCPFLWVQVPDPIHFAFLQVMAPPLPHSWSFWFGPSLNTPPTATRGLPTIHPPEAFLHFLTPHPNPGGYPSSASNLHFHYFLYHSTNFRLPLHPKCPNEKLGRHTPTMNIPATVIENTRQRTVQQQSPREKVAGPLGPLKNLYGTVKIQNANSLNPVTLTQNLLINPRPRRKPEQNPIGKNRET